LASITSTTSFTNTSVCGTSEYIFLNITGNTAWTPLTLTPFDGCGVCNGRNQVKDNTGVCFGSNFTSIIRNTWYVSPNGTGAGTSINSPLGNLAAVLPLVNYLDTVIMLPGTYTGSSNYGLIFPGKAFCLKSQNSQPDQVIINCNTASKTVFTFTNGESYDTQIIGITIENCAKTPVNCNYTSPTFSNMIFNMNHFSSGNAGAITSVASFFQVDRSQFLTNAAGTNGGAFYIDSPPQSLTAPYIHNSLFYNNNAGGFGGAIYLTNGGALTIDTCVFTGNVDAGNSGSAIYQLSGSFPFADG
jgi:hypothetical protein